MAAQPRTRVGSLTVEDYERLTADTDRRYELIHGELIEMPSPGTLHQAVQYYLASLLVAFVMQWGLGRVYGAPTDVQLVGVVVQPDLFFVSRERSGIVTPQRATGAPDLVMELLSPSTRKHDLTTKREIYRLEGVREYWVIDIESRSATVWALVEDRYVAQGPDADGFQASTVLPGFTIDVAAAIAAVE